MDSIIKFILVSMCVIILLVVGGGAGHDLGKNSAYNSICTKAGYDGYQQIENDTYCYKGSGDDIVFVLVEPRGGGNTP